MSVIPAQLGGGGPGLAAEALFAGDEALGNAASPERVYLRELQGTGAALREGEAFAAVNARTRAKRLERWHKEHLAAGMVGRDDAGRLWVRPHVRINGRTAGRWLSGAAPEPGGPRIADGWGDEFERLSLRNGQRFVTTMLLLERTLDRLRGQGLVSATRERLDVSAIRAIGKTEIIAAAQAAYTEDEALRSACQAAGLKPHRVISYIQRTDKTSPKFNFNADNRGRKAGLGRAIAECDWAQFVARTAGLEGDEGQVRRALKQAYDEVAAAAWKRGEETASYSTYARKWRRELGLAERVLGREGEQAFKANVLPKLVREKEDREAWPAGVLWSVDGYVSNRLRRVFIPGKGWKLRRFTIVIFYCRATGFILGAAAGYGESTDLMREAFARAVEANGGGPREILCDRSKAFSAVMKRGGLKALERIGSLLGFAVRLAQVREAWVKEQESWHRRLDAADKDDGWYCGASLDKKPERLRALVRQAGVMSCPTLEAFDRDELPAIVAEINATPSEGRGCHGLTPTVVHEQRRGEVRRIEPHLLAHALADKLPGRVIKHSSCVRVRRLFGALIYRPAAENWTKITSRSVFVLAGRDLSFVTLLDEHERPVCRLHCMELSGANVNDLREAARENRRITRATKETLRHRTSQFLGTAAQINAVRREHREAIQTEMRAALPAPAAPRVTIVRPDLAADARRVAEADNKPAPDARRRGFEKLAAKAEAETARCGLNDDELTRDLLEQLAEERAERERSERKRREEHERLFFSLDAEAEPGQSVWHRMEKAEAERESGGERKAAGA